LASEFSAESYPEREGDAVKRRRFSVEQIVAVLKQSQGRDAGVAELIRHVGISELAGGLKIAAEAQKGASIPCMLPDTGERYLSAPRFADVAADMNEEELAISRSTPSCQLKT